jgi:hypothetical protein
LLLGLITQLNDYSGTLDSHVAFNIGNDDTLGFLGTTALLRNSILIFLLTNLMPDTKTVSSDSGIQILFGLYQLVIPSLCAILIFVPTTLMLKKGKYQVLSSELSD